MKYISSQNLVKLIHHVGLKTFLIELSNIIEEDYKRWNKFDKSPRYVHHSEYGVNELMPTSDQELFSFKYVNGHPNNFNKHLQTVVAFGVLCDVKTGYPVLLSEMNIGTALRTAAMSALAAKYLCNKNAKTMGMIGAGCQAEFQAHAFRAINNISSIKIYDIDPKVSEKFLSNMAGTGFNITICKPPQEAIENVDIITTCTADKQYATILTDNMVGQGVHINAIGGDCPGKTELHPDILSRGRVFVEYEPQSRIEGEIQQMPEDFNVTEIYKVIQSGENTRKSLREITIFDSVGLQYRIFHSCATST